MPFSTACSGVYNWMIWHGPFPSVQQFMLVLQPRSLTTWWWACAGAPNRTPTRVRCVCESLGAQNGRMDAKGFFWGITWVCDDFCIFVSSSIEFKGFPGFPLNASIAWMMLPYSWAQVRVVQNRIRNSRQRFEAAKQEAAEDNTVTTWVRYGSQWYGSIPINTIFSGMKIHLLAILMFTRGTRFWPIPI